MNKLLHASAIAVAATTSGAYAEAHVVGAMDSAGLMEMGDTLIRTRDITGGAIYTTNQANDEGWEAGTVYNEIGADWNEIGEIEDLVLSPEGQLVAIVAEVGGLLDIGDKHVLIPLGDISLVAVDDSSYYYVTRLNEEQLESMPGVDEGFWD